MTLLVTAGAGFFGSSFVFDWLSQLDETVINLDKHTHAGDLLNLEDHKIFGLSDRGGKLLTNLYQKWNYV